MYKQKEKRNSLHFFLEIKLYITKIPIEIQILPFLELLFLIDYLITLSGAGYHVFGMFPHTIKTIWKNTNLTIKSSFLYQFS
jgi:hypothetical protein